MIRKHLLSAALFLVTAFVFSSALAVPNPTEQLKFTIDKVLAVLQESNLDNEAKRDKIRVIIGERFDFRAMSIRTLGKNWKAANGAQQKRFTAAYRRLLEDTYLVMVEAYTDEKVNFVKESIKKNKYAQVNTQIVRAGAPPIPVNYKSRLRKDEWWVYDVVIEGVSMISNYRTSYQQIAKNDGIDGLIAQIEQKIAAGDTPTAAKSSGS